jgi:hyperosmotically inducible protein
MSWLGQNGDQRLGGCEMFKNRRAKLPTLALLALTFYSGLLVVAAQSIDSYGLSEQVRKKLVTLPYYGVFDNLEYNIQGSVVTLSGQVVRPSTRSDAEARVKRIPGVERVINNIRVLPLSSMDAALRRRVYRAVFGFAGLSRYAMGVNPSIHIIVDSGHVTLEGVVDNQTDSNMTYIRANGVPGVFSVTNHLRVQNSRQR